MFICVKSYNGALDLIGKSEKRKEINRIISDDYEKELDGWKIWEKAANGDRRKIDCMIDTDNGKIDNSMYDKHNFAYIDIFEHGIENPEYRMNWKVFEI